MSHTPVKNRKKKKKELVGHQHFFQILEEQGTVVEVNGRNTIILMCFKM